MSLRNYSLDDQFVSQMDQNYLKDGGKRLNGQPTIRMAMKVDRLMTCFSRPKYKYQDDALQVNEKKNKYETVYQILAIILYIVCTLIMLANLYHHYVYEYYLLQYHEFNLYRNKFSSNLGRKIEDYLKAKIETTRAELIDFGAPLLLMAQLYPFAPICFYLNIISFGLSVYGSFLFYLRYVKPVESLYFFRVFADPRREQHQTNLVIRNKTNEVLQSSKYFTEKLINIRLNELNNQPLPRESPKREQWASFHYNHSHGDEQIRAYIGWYKRNAERLREICLSGQLNPISRSPEWLDRLALLYCISNYCIYLLIMGFGPLGLFFFVGDLNLMAALVMLSILGNTVIFAMASVFYLNTIVMTVIDHIRSVCYINSRMLKCIRDNEKLSARHNDDLQQHSNNLINDRLLMVVMEYKILMVHLKETWPILSWLFIITWFITFLFPLIGRIHLNYLRIPSVSFYVIALGVSALLAIDMHIIPTCYLQASCIRLQRSLSSLQAHVVDTNIRKSGLKYNKHTSLLLRYEYWGTFRSSHRSFTYEKALKLHFWVSIVILSILFETKDSWNSILAGLLSDPFNFKRLQYDHLAEL